MGWFGDIREKGRVNINICRHPITQLERVTQLEGYLGGSRNGRKSAQNVRKRPKTSENTPKRPKTAKNARKCQNFSPQPPNRESSAAAAAAAAVAVAADAAAAAAVAVAAAMAATIFAESVLSWG